MSPVEVPSDPEARAVLVGGSVCRVSVDEWVGARLERGEAVVCERKGRGNRPPRIFYGVFRSTWFYDGVIARVLDLTDIDRATEESLFLSHAGDSIWPARGVVMVAPEQAVAT